MQKVEVDIVLYTNIFSYKDNYNNFSPVVSPLADFPPVLLHKTPQDSQKLRKTACHWTLTLRKIKHSANH